MSSFILAAIPRQVYNERNTNKGVFVMKKRSMIWAAALCLLLLLPVNAYARETPTFDTVAQAADYLRDGMSDRSFTAVSDYAMTASVRIPGSCAANAPTAASQLMEELYAHTGQPEGGDYLLRSSSGFTSASSDGEYYTVDVTLYFEHTHAQEAQLDAAVAELLAELNLSGKSDYEKVRTIYDWMCRNISYDYSYSNYSPYHALCERSAVCQGYATLFYRLCLELGVDCRYCGGYAFNDSGSGESHGWNLVRVDGQYYFVDTTWGASLVDGEPDYYYFLKGSDGMPDHLIPPQRWAEEIGDYCTVSPEDYAGAESTEVIGSGFCGDNITYTVTKNGTMTVSGTGTAQMPYGSGLERIRNVVFEEGITAIEPNAFYFNSICGVSLPESLTTIGDKAFTDCHLTQLHIPAGVTQIGTDALGGRAFQQITVDPANTAYTAINGSLYTKDGKTLLRYAGMMTDDGELIKECTLPNGVAVIAPYAFGGNAQLTHVVLPNTVTHIGEYAFRFSNYVQVDLPESLISIGDYAFDNCNSQKDVYIGPYVASIGDCAFNGFGITNITVHPDNPNFACAGGVLFSRDMTRLICYPAGKQDTTYTIPDGVTEIAPGAFSTFSPRAVLEQVAFPDSLRVIGNSAFTDQAKLQSLTLPRNLEIIGDYAFVGSLNERIDTIVIPDSVKSIGQSAFNYHRASTVVIGSGVESIGTGAFYSEHERVGGSLTVYFRGARPEMGEGDYNEQLFARGSSTVCFLPEHADSWVPHGEIMWMPYPTLGEAYPLTAYHETANGTRHIYDAAVISGSCADPNYITYTCTGCSHSFRQDFIPLDGHQFVVDRGVAATCTQPGLTSGRHCTICGFCDPAQEEIAPTGHWYMYGACVYCGDVDPGYFEPAFTGVTRIFGADRYETAFKTAEVLKQQLGVTKFDSIVVACGDNFADALGGSYLAAKKNAPILLVKSSKIDAVKDYIKANLNPGGTVYLLGGTAAIPAAMDTGLDDFNVKRLAGATRYDTNLLILQEAGVTNEDILICTGTNFADSLSAAAAGRPILLVKDSLNDSQKAFLQSHAANKKYILGGTAAVSTSVENQVKAYGTVERIGGNTRYETSVLIAKEFFPDATQAALAYAQNFPDGLSGGALAYAMKAPLVLTASGKESAAAAYAKEQGITSGVILGGSGLISDKTVRTIFQMQSGDTIKIG